MLFAYTEKHTQDFVKKLFGDFKGYLQSDASNVYDILERGPPSDAETDDIVKLVGCWAHCRRYFFEAAICKYPVGLQGLMRIRAIYAIDDSFRKLPPAKRKTMRDEHVRPLMDGLFQWAKQARGEAQGPQPRNQGARLRFQSGSRAPARARLTAACRSTTRARSVRSERSSSAAKTGCSTAATATPRAPPRSSRSSPPAGSTRSIPQQYLDEVLRVLPYWPRERYLELAPNNWTATRAKLDPDELDAPLCSFTIPPG